MVLGPWKYWRLLVANKQILFAFRSLVDLGVTSDLSGVSVRKAKEIRGVEGLHVLKRGLSEHSMKQGTNGR